MRWPAASKNEWPRRAPEWARLPNDPETVESPTEEKGEPEKMLAAEAQADAVTLDETQKKEAVKPEEAIAEVVVHPDAALKTEEEEIKPDSTIPIQ